MRRFQFIFILIMTITGLGIALSAGRLEKQEDAANTMEGRILYWSKTVFIIQNQNFSKADAERVSNFTYDELLEQYPGLSTLMTENDSLTEGIENGEKVRIWHGEILESYPARIKVLKVERIE